MEASYSELVLVKVSQGFDRGIQTMRRKTYISQNENIILSDFYCKETNREKMKKLCDRFFKANLLTV